MTIPLLSGGAITPLDVTPFHNPAYKVAPAALPDLPAGVSIADLLATAADLNTTPEDAATLRAEAAIRSKGYLPVYDAEGSDQYGLPPESGTDDADPLLRPSPPEPIYTLTGREDKRTRPNALGNRGNPNGQTILASDSSRRTWARVWYDILTANELWPISRRLTDPEIVRRLRELFPKRGISERTVVRQRQRYNAGQLNVQKGKPPKRTSFRYYRDDTHIFQWATRGRLVATWDLVEMKGGDDAFAPAPPEDPPEPQAQHATADSTPESEPEHQTEGTDKP